VDGKSDACLKCTICVSQCPVYWDDLEFPGPKALGPEWFRNHLAGAGAPVAHVDDCTFCQLCEAACPVGVPIAHLIAEQKAQRRPPWPYRVRDFVLKRPHWVARAPWLGQVRGWPGRLLKLASHTRRPPIRRQKVPSLTTSAVPVRGQVALFVDCFARGYDREAVGHARALMELWGFRVTLLPHDSQCCGAAAYASGDPSLARAIGGTLHRALISALTRRPDIQTVVTLNATCDSTLAFEWPEHYGLRLPVAVVPFDRFALEQAPSAFWDRLALGRGSDQSGAMVVHTTCRAKVARGQGSMAQLLRQAGFSSVETLDLACCGAAGSYAFKAEHEAVSHRMAERAALQLTEPANRLAVDSGTCAVHLEQVTGVMARHPATWLYLRYREAVES
jgi:glycerol-3-phosphate dehydrogenase subunit C